MSPNPIGSRVEQLAQALAERIVPLIVDAIDIDAILDKVDVEKIIERVDVDKIVERVDVQKIIDRVDVQQIIERVDINAIVDKIDIDSLVEQTELGSIIARSTTGVLTEILDVIRAQGVGLDDFILRWGNRLVGRGKQDRRLARRAAAPRGAEAIGAVTTVPVPSPELTVGRQGHYAGAVSRLAAFAADVGASWGLYTLGVALLNAAVKLVTGHSYTLSNHQTLAAVIVLTVWEFLYFTYQWAVSGKTLGMAILGLQVVTTQGGPISGRQAVLRTLGLGFTLFLTLGHRVPRHRVPARTARPRRLHRRDRRRLRLGRPGRPPALDRPQGGPHAARGAAQGAGRSDEGRLRSGVTRASTMPRMSFTEITRPHPQVAVVTLNRPERMNAMAFDVMIPFRDALREIGNDNAVRVVVITGAGRGFCSGADHENPGTMPNMDGLTLPDHRAALHGDARRRHLDHPPTAPARHRRRQRGRHRRRLLPRPGGRHPDRLGRGLLPGRGHQQRPDGGRARTELPAAAVRGALAGGRDHAHGPRRRRERSGPDRAGLASRGAGPSSCRPASSWPTASTAGAGPASS